MDRFLVRKEYLDEYDAFGALTKKTLAKHWSNGTITTEILYEHKRQVLDLTGKPWVRKEKKNK